MTIIIIKIVYFNFSFSIWNLIPFVELKPLRDAFYPIDDAIYPYFPLIFPFFHKFLWHLFLPAEILTFGNRLRFTHCKEFLVDTMKTH